MNWRAAFFCVDCHKQVSDHIRCYNSGICPHCGYKGPSAVTIMDTYTRAYRLKRIYPNWWSYIRPKYKPVWKDPTSRPVPGATGLGARK